MADDLDAVEPALVPRANVAFDPLDTVQLGDRLAAEKEAVDDADAVPALDEPAAQLEADIAGAAGDENVQVRTCGEGTDAMNGVMGTCASARSR
ncbi:MAG: hypothetical protein JO140_00880 [Candidatus Eremiobacteraeota bacterium]|nr:hypothetical protein [Candidatus Eremiobacteraeota bacterium]